MVHSFAPLTPAALAVLAALPGAAHAGDGRSLAAMRGDHRVVLVFAPSMSDASLQTQRDIMTRFAAGALDRDLRLVQVAGNAVVGSHDDAARLRRRYNVAPDHFRVLLIGKDGNVALRQDAPLTAASLEAAIDAMPMRRAETARRK